MKFSEKMCLMIILKVAKNHGFTLSLANTFLEKPQRRSFPNIYILSHVNYYIHPLTLIIALEIKAVGFSKARKTSNNIFLMHYGDIKD